MITEVDAAQEQVVANLPLGTAKPGEQLDPTLPEFSAEDMGDWLVGHRPHDVVGAAQNPHACPMANYVRARLDEQEATLLESPKSGGAVAVALGRVILGRAKVLDLSPWACEFVTDVDEGPTSRITAAHALEVLERSTARHRDVQ